MKSIKFSQRELTEQERGKIIGMFAIELLNIDFNFDVPDKNGNCEDLIKEFSQINNELHNDFFDRLAEATEIMKNSSFTVFEIPKGILVIEVTFFEIEALTLTNEKVIEIDKTIKHYFIENETGKIEDWTEKDYFSLKDADS